MTKFTRRNVLTGAALAATATALSPLGGRLPARAAAPPVGRQAPGYYRYKIGAFEVTVVTDGVRPTPLADNFVRNAQKDAVSAGLATTYLGMDRERPVYPFTPVVVNTGPKLVVIDTGLGQATYEQSKGVLGQFHTNLTASGIDAKSVDVVVISHFHGDHINGLIGPDNKPAFPNAEIMVPKAEWDYWTDDGNASRAPEGTGQGDPRQLEARVRCARPQGDAVRSRQGDRARHHLGVHAGPYVGPHFTHRCVGHRTRPGPGGR